MKMNETIEMPKPPEKIARETMKVSKEAKDLLYLNKNRGETYSDVIIKLAKRWNSVFDKWSQHLVDEDMLNGECDCNLCKAMSTSQNLI